MGWVGGGWGGDEGTRQVLELWFPPLYHRPLHLTSDMNCTDGQFTCITGGCVPWLHKCDGKLDCKDGTDEFMCRKLLPIASHTMQ